MCATERDEEGNVEWLRCAGGVITRMYVLNTIQSLAKLAAASPEICRAFLCRLTQFWDWSTGKSARVLAHSGG